MPTSDDLKSTKVGSGQLSPSQMWKAKFVIKMAAMTIRRPKGDRDNNRVGGNSMKIGNEEITIAEAGLLNKP